MAIFVIMNFVGTMYITIWALFASDALRMDELAVGLSLSAYGLFHAGAQAFLTGPTVARLGEKWALVVGMACELTALAILAVATQGWIVFALTPLFALSGIGMPALQSLTTQQIDADNQGKLQGVLASFVSLSTVFGPLFFGFAYFALKPGWPGATWLVGAAVYLFALPLMLAIRRTPARDATMPVA
jgi:DHA1 family tetracycline resistance protein-like MFS transporter